MVKGVPFRLGFTSRSRYEEAVEAIANMMGAVPPGDPSDAGTMMGPLISARQRDRVERYVQSAIDEGAKVVWGKRPEGSIVDSFMSLH